MEHTGPVLTHAAKAAEYLVAAGTLVLFAFFWRYVQGAAAPGRPVRWPGRWLAAVALLLILVFVASVAQGAGSLRLPAERVWKDTADSPGAVAFRHETHVDADRPDCTSCHPRLFPILRDTPRAKVTHSRMDTRQQCGACHDGVRAFSREDCTSCHAGE